MNKISRTIVDAAWFVACFLLIQLVCTCVCMLIWKDFSLNSIALGISLLTSSLITVVLYWAQHWWKESKQAAKSVSKYVYISVFFIACCSIVPSMALLELLGVEANETQERILMEIMNSPLGFLIIAIAVPLAEEVVFRGSFLRLLLENRFVFMRKKANSNSSHWLPIVISAIVFGLIHGNIAQFLHATMIGILLGWIYYHTKSILPGVFLHVVNNFLTFAIITYIPDAQDKSLIELNQGRIWLLIVQLVVFLAVIALSIWRINIAFSNKQENYLDNNQQEI